MKMCGDMPALSPTASLQDPVSCMGTSLECQGALDVQNGYTLNRARGYRREALSNVGGAVSTLPLDAAHPESRRNMYRKVTGPS